MQKGKLAPQLGVGLKGWVERSRNGNWLRLDTPVIRFSSDGWENRWKCAKPRSCNGKHNKYPHITIVRFQFRVTSIAENVQCGTPFAGVG
jgi:hypothetical protein